MEYKPEPSPKGFWRWEAVSVIIFLLGLLSLGLIVVINHLWEYQTREFISVDAVTDLRTELTTFYLRLEEYPEGDSAAEAERIREMYTGVRELARTLLNGGTNQPGFAVLPFDDPELRAEAEKINDLITGLEEPVISRLRGRPDGRPLSAADPSLRKAFDEIAARAERLEAATEADIIRKTGQFRRLYEMILVFWTVTVVVVTIVLGVLTKKRRRSEQALKASQEKYKSLVDSTEDSIYLVDAGCDYLFVNKKHMKRLGLSEDTYKGRNYADFHTPEETEEFRKRIVSGFSTGESAQYEHQSLRDGRYFLQTFSPVRDTDGSITAVTVISKNITDRRQMENELRALSLTDELTGLYNRRGFFTLAEQQIKIATRLKKKLYLLAADLDDLKVINDTFGHHEGDSALLETANILRENFRESDIIARIGGDEFVVMPIEMSDGRSEAILARLNQGFEKSNEKNRLRYRISISTGITVYDPDHPVTIEGMLDQADNSMYEQKKLKKFGQGNSGNGPGNDPVRDALP